MWQASALSKKEDWLNDHTIIKTISISEFFPEKIDSIKRYIENNLSWTFSKAINMQPINIAQNDTVFMIKLRVATDDIVKAIKE